MDNRVLCVYGRSEHQGWHFQNAQEEAPEKGKRRHSVILDTLETEAPALTLQQNEQLFNAVMEDYADVKLKHDRLKKVKEDDYFNAIQIKYAYAVTCHKSTRL